MFTPASTLTRSGVIALGVLTGFGGTAMAAPLGPIQISAPSAGSNFPIEAVRDRGGQMIWPRRGGGRTWGGGNWNGNRAWRGNGNWNGRHWKGGHGHHHGHDDDDFGVVIGLGLPLLGLGLGYGGYGGYYNGYYPRRYYGTGNGHVQWCYSRYRSYRAWDNTYQPYNGPRRQCHSPYG